MPRALLTQLSEVVAMRLVVMGWCDLEANSYNTWVDDWQYRERKGISGSIWSVQNKCAD